MSLIDKVIKKYHIPVKFRTIIKVKLLKFCNQFCKQKFNIDLVSTSFKIKNYFSDKKPVP